MAACRWRAAGGLPCKPTLSHPVDEGRLADQGWLAAGGPPAGAASAMFVGSGASGIGNGDVRECLQYIWKLVSRCMLLGNKQESSKFLSNAVALVVGGGTHTSKRWVPSPPPPPTHTHCQWY